MVDFTAVATGDWDDPATWDVGSGYPDDSVDTATIGVFTVTIPSDLTIAGCGAITLTGTSAGNRSVLVLNGSLTINATMTINNWNQWDIGPGAVFDRNSQVIDYTSAGAQRNIQNFIGTSGSRGIYKNTGGIGQMGRTVLSNGVSMGLTWQFLDIIDAVDINVGSNFNAGDSVLIEDVAITDSENMTIGNWRNPVDDFIIRRVDVRGAKVGGNIILIYPHLTTGSSATGTTDVSSLTFLGTSGTASASDNKVRSHGDLLSYDNCVFSNVYHERIIDGPTTVSGSLFDAEGIDSIGNNSGNDVVEDCYVLCSDHTVNGSCNTFLRNVIEANYAAGYSDDADHFIIGNADTTIEYNIILEKYSGVFLNAIGSPRAGIHNLNHNTLIGNYDAAYGALARTEAGGSFTGTVNAQSNIIYDKSATAGSLGFNIDTAGDDQITLMDQNNWYNIENKYSGVTSATKTAGVTVGYGGNDTSLDPQFFDDTRNISQWHSVVVGGAATDAAAVTYLLGINGYDSGTKSQTATKATHTPADLLSWVRDGYRIQNGTLENAGHDSVTVGAMEYVAAAGGIGVSVGLLLGVSSG